MIKTGELNQRIDIMAFQDESDGAGGSISQEFVYWSTFAKVTPMKSGSYLQANQESLKDGFDITVRYRIDKSIKQDMRIKYRTGHLTIISAPTDYVNKQYIQFKAVWSQRPETTEAPPPEFLAYYGYLNEGETLTSEIISAGQSFSINNNEAVTVPYNTSDFKVLWLALPSGQTIKTSVTDLNNDEITPIGDSGTFASPVTIDTFNAYVTNFATVYSGVGLKFV